MASEIRVNQIQSRTGVSTISFTETGPIISGVTTVIGNLDVTGLVSYDDVTNIDSVGVITARDGLHVSGGSLGIGDESPTKPLTVGTTTPVILLDDQSNRTLEIRGPSTTHVASILTTSGHSLLLGTNDTERLRITYEGGVKIGSGNNDASMSEFGSNTGGLTIDDVGVNNTGIRLSHGNDDTYLVQSSNSNFYISQYGTGNMIFGVGSSGNERLRITSAGNLGIGGLVNPGALLSIPAGESNTPRLAIESAVDDNDFTITQYEDGNGTYTMLGQNVKLNSSGNNTILDSAHRTAAIQLDARNHGNVTFYTGAVNAVAERVQITAQGLLGINHASASQIGKELTIRPGDDGGIRFIRPGETASNPNKHLELTTTTSGSAYPSGEGYTVKYKTYNCDQIFETYEGGGTGGHIAFKTAPQGGTPSDRFVIDENGTVLTNAATIDNTSSHGVIVAHAPASNADTGYKSIEIGNSNGNNSSRGSTICGQPKSNSHPPFTLVGCWDDGSNTDVYYGGGWGSNMRPATRHRFYTHGSYPTANSSGTLNMTLDGNGHLTLPNQPLFQATGQPSHRYMNSWNSVDLPDWNFVTQNGSHFNNSSGRFTAPIAGKYYFIFTAMYTNPSTNDVATYIIKNGTTEVLSNNHSGGGSSNGHQWNDITVHAIVNLAVNDWVSARMVANSSATCYFYGTNGSKYGSFSGFLIG